MARRRMNWKKITSLMMLGFLGFSFIGLSFSSIPFHGALADSAVRYNGIAFTQTHAGVTAEIDGTSYVFSAYPTDVEYLRLDPALLERIKTAGMLYVTSDPADPAAESIGGFAYDVSAALQRSGAYVQVAFTENTSYNLPVISCNDATPFVPVIFVQSANTTRFSAEGDCLSVQGSSATSISWARDRLVYGILGVIA